MKNEHTSSRKPYTPGPYTFNQFGSGSEEYVTIVDQVCGAELAHIIVPSDELEQALANAQLFAAAPELVDALEHLIAAVKSSVTAANKVQAIVDRLHSEIPVPFIRGSFFNVPRTNNHRVVVHTKKEAQP